MSTPPRQLSKPKKRWNRFRLRRRSQTVPELGGTLPADPPRYSHYILPNLFTSASLFLALFSIVKSAEGEFIIASWLIIGAALCDVIDGPVARLTRTASSFGLQYDSLADLVAFGVAPAFLMFWHLQAMDETVLPDHAPKLALGACALYAICSAIRLARFNVQADNAEKRYFTGLPTPGAAGVVVTAYLFVVWLGNLTFVAELEDAAWLTRGLHRSILFLMVGMALLMVSEVPFMKLKNIIQVSRKPFNTLVFVVLVVCMAIVFMDYLPLLLFGGFAVYIIGGLWGEARRRFRRRFRQQHPETPGQSQA